MMRKRLGCSLLALFLVGTAAELQAFKNPLKKNEATYKNLNKAIKQIRKDFDKVIGKVRKLKIDTPKLQSNINSYNNDPDKVARIKPLEETLGPKIKELKDAANEVSLGRRRRHSIG